MERRGSNAATTDVDAAAIESLPLSNRTLCRLRDAGIATIGQLAERSDEQLLALDGFGHTCLGEVRAALRVLEVAGRDPLLDPDDESFPTDVSAALHATRLGDLPIPNRARSVFRREGIATVGEFLARGPQGALALKNFGAVTLANVNRAIRAADHAVRDGERLEPLLRVPRIGGGGAAVEDGELGRIPLSQLDLPRRARRVCTELGIRTLRDLAALERDALLVRRNLGQATLRRIQREVERFLAQCQEPEKPGFAGTLESLLARLQPKERRLIELREGCDDDAPRTLVDVGAALEITESRACQIEHAAWSKLRRFAADRLEPVAIAAERVLLAAGGLAPPDALLADPEFAAIGLRPRFLGRMLARLIPHRLARLADERLAALPAATLLSLTSRLRKRLRRGGEPPELDALVAEIGRGLDLDARAPRIVAALCENFFRREVTPDERGRARVHTATQALGDALRRVLADAGGPLHFAAIAKQLAASGRSEDADPEKVRLRLCRDDRFVLVGRGMYDLALRFALPEPVRTAIVMQVEAVLLETSRPTSVALLQRAAAAADPSLAGVSEYAFATVLRSAPAFRHLGRGTFVLAAAAPSSVAHVSDLLVAILEEECAPLAYAELRRRVHEKRRVSDGAISATLVGHAAFVRIARGRFDLASRWPLDDAARRAIAASCRATLASRSGVASLEDLAAALDGETFATVRLHPVLIGDVLRRAGGFEFLGSGFVQLADDSRLAELADLAYTQLRSAGEPLRPSTLARKLQLDAARTAALRRALRGDDRFTSLADGRYALR
jgi:DNA-directed RNA polymerase alpha subunit